MNTRYKVFLNGEGLADVSPQIIILDVSYAPPARELMTVPIAGRDGQLLIKTQTGSLSVSVTFEIHERDIKRRAHICQQVQEWAAHGGRLTTNDKPGKELRVVCESFPVISSALHWTDRLRLVFTAYAVPYWIDEDPEKTTISGNGSADVYAPGIAAPPIIEAAVRNTGGGTINRVQLSAGKTALNFASVGLAPGKVLTVNHDAHELLAAEIDGVSVLQKRMAQSNDELNVEPMENVRLSVSTDGTAETTFSMWGCYL